MLGEHLSSTGSYTETETMAAGPMQCRIERDFVRVPAAGD